MELSEKLVLLRGVDSRASVAERLKIQESTLRNYEKALSLPNFDVTKRICVEFGVTPTWLLFDEGPMHPGELPNPAVAPDPPPTTTPETSSCARCAKLEAKVDRVELQRDELAVENRQLLRENGDLKAKCAVLEERQKMCCPDPLLQQPPPSGLSSEMRAKA